MLRSLSVADARAVQAGEPIPGLPFAEGYPLPDTSGGLGLFLRHADPTFGLFVLVRRDDGLVIGEIGFFAPPKRGAVTIGYAVVPNARRQGYATEAIRALADWALAQPEVEQVRAMVERQNKPSERALLRVGFVEDAATEKARSFGYRGLSARSSPPSSS